VSNKFPQEQLSMLDIPGFEYFQTPEDSCDRPPVSPLAMVKVFSDTMQQEPDPDLQADLIFEELGEWEDEDDPVHELKELADLVYVIYGYALARGWDLDEAVRRVHKNNMTRCIWPDGSVHRREDGKILKNPDAPKIDLSDLVEKIPQ